MIFVGYFCYFFIIIIPAIFVILKLRRIKHKVIVTLLLGFFIALTFYFYQSHTELFGEEPGYTLDDHKGWE